MVYAASWPGARVTSPRTPSPRHCTVLAGVGLPTAYESAGEGSWEALLTAMRRDKKSRGAQLRFCRPGGHRSAGQLEVSEDCLRAAFAAIQS